MCIFRFVLVTLAVIAIIIANGAEHEKLTGSNEVVLRVYDSRTDELVWVENHSGIDINRAEKIRLGEIVSLPAIDDGEYYLEIIVDGERYGDLIAFSGREELRRILSSGGDPYDIPPDPGDIMDDGYILRLGGPEVTDITHLRGMLGIGTEAPTAQLHTTGSVRFSGAGTPGDGRVLTSDDFGNATWSLPEADNYEGWRLRVGVYDPYLVSSYDEVELVGTGGIDIEYEDIGGVHTLIIDGTVMGVSNWAYSEETGYEDDIYNLNIGNVGIGTNIPGAMLHVDGSVRLDSEVRFTGIAGTGDYLTIDADGYITRTTVSGGGGDCNWETHTGGIHYNHGNVGVGTAAPTARLEVENPGATALRISGIFHNQGVEYSQTTDTHPNAWNTIETVVITTSGSGADGSSVLINAFFSCMNYGWMGLRILRNGSEIFQAYDLSGVYDSWDWIESDHTQSATWIDEPPAGTHTYTLQWSAHRFPSLWYSRSLSIVEIKR